MEILKSINSKKSQSQFIFIVIIAAIGVLMIGSVFFVFSEIKRDNEEFIRENNLESFGEKLTSSIIHVYVVGENINYIGLENKLLYSTSLIIPQEYSKYRINVSSDKVVITHRNKKKEIKIHNLNNIEVNGIIVGKNKITLEYYKNKTDKRIVLS